MKHVLLQHQERVLLSVDEYGSQGMNIRRYYLLEDSFRQYSKHSFDVNKRIMVRFVGEPSVDEGGPRREYFHLLLHEIFEKSGLFAGYPNHCVPLHNVEALSSNKYYLIGRMLAVCIVQSGATPSCFATAVADFIVWNQN